MRRDSPTVGWRRPLHRNTAHISCPQTSSATSAPLDILSRQFPTCGQTVHPSAPPGSSDGLHGSPSLNHALSPLCPHPSCSLGHSLAVSSLKQQHPEHHQDQDSHAHADEILHCVVWGLGGYKMWRQRSAWSGSHKSAGLWCLPQAPSSPGRQHPWDV